ncbi:acetylxylan esterase [Kribbella sp. NPDC054772]
MAMFDLPLDKLREYRPEVAAPADLVEFWRRSIEKARTDDLSASFTEIDNKLAVIDTYDVTYAGFGGSPVKGWLHVPAGATGPLPTIVQYHGYSGGRGLPHAINFWAQAGYAHFVTDTRGQGWTSGGSSTPDDSAYAGLSHVPGFLTSGITDPETYYYRRVYIDAVRALEAARTSPFVDPDRLVVAGVSQGGGIAIATAGLAPLAGIELRGCAADVPFLCHFQRAVQLTDRGRYNEIAQYLKGSRHQVDTALNTLSYFDGVNLGRLATAPALFSVALMDANCPPSTVFAAYNHYGSEQKDIEVYPYNEHEGGQAYQQEAQLDWFSNIFATPTK